MIKTTELDQHLFRTIEDRIRDKVVQIDDVKWRSWARGEKTQTSKDDLILTLERWFSEFNELYCITSISDSIAVELKKIYPNKSQKFVSPIKPYLLDNFTLQELSNILLARYHGYDGLIYIDYNCYLGFTVYYRDV